ncbi:hypothetical protein [Pseudomonas sp. TH31]|uniref:hypothetical protein n=1 Tax=Pseudomonas sp. TH31 TaxID=2796396 RepID=UPI0019137D29|nr:hypothetical protein [Pseudomonas sp. TH31]MBK5416400.1 hypothetical protein [Pseudomonas sp. TH31]
MTKEDIYDEQINPLMAKIISICKEHNIAFIFSAHIPNDEDPDLACTTHLPGDGGECYEPFVKAFHAIRTQAAPAIHTRIINGDGSATLTAYIG